ncbi:glutathionylspermidine synthase family protein [Deinococcus fonticola]|uniref:glutathionylspermidine synthase family protein n=1 Tax=Deinococcus fonticola TaxID=2528713 RepID=UPI00107556A0|nr:glutathionylspermidine synthase family protein [Deinococcus fonticola]
MKRLPFRERPGWQDRLEQVGFTWHTGSREAPFPYWEEDAAYSFTAAEIELLERRSGELVALALDAVAHAIETRRLGQLGIPDFLHDAVKASWDRDDPSVYLRLDLAYSGGDQEPKLLEINAQTPTSLLEAAVCQWQWLEDRQETGELPQSATQWNAIHEALTAQWQWASQERGVREVTFAAARLDEDLATSTYLEELARAAGIKTQRLWVDEIGSSAAMDQLADLWGLPIGHLAMLWPFEFAWEGRDAAYLASTRTRFIEPLWKAVMSSKGLLPLMHELAPEHPCILPARFVDSLNLTNVGMQPVRKPLWSREGQNVQLPGQAATGGEYGDLPLIEQAYVELPEYQAGRGESRYPVLGVWVAGDEPCGLGVREGVTRVTDDRARFVPHLVQDE